MSRSPGQPGRKTQQECRTLIKPVDAVETPDGERRFCALLSEMFLKVRRRSGIGEPEAPPRFVQTTGWYQNLII